jgi:hypothetical protein
MPYRRKVLGALTVTDLPVIITMGPLGTQGVPTITDLPVTTAMDPLGTQGIPIPTGLLVIRMGRTNPRVDLTLTDLPMIHMGHLIQPEALVTRMGLPSLRMTTAMGRTIPQVDPTLMDLPTIRMGHLIRPGALILTDLPVIRTGHLGIQVAVGVSILLFLS